MNFWIKKGYKGCAIVSILLLFFCSCQPTDINEKIRVINGDVLTGETSFARPFLGYFNNLVSIIPEGDKYRMIGWLPFIDNNILN